jgi:hypothetical protein
LQAEKRESELTRLREAIRVTDIAHSSGMDESAKREDIRGTLEQQLVDAEAGIKEAQTARKVYTHMYERIHKEQALLKEKLLLMETHLDRKQKESQRKQSLHERLKQKRAKAAQDLDILEADFDHERVVRQNAHENMEAAIKAKEDAADRRTQFEEWRREVAVDAANEAFNASAGRLRKLFAIEKLVGNSLQYMSLQQAERSMSTEEGFQRIREVTGLTDVMDIVHKFLNREVEHEQLKSSVKEAEVRREALKEQYDRFKRDTSGLTFDLEAIGRARGLYVEVDEHEKALQQARKDHEQSRQKLQTSSVQIEHMKRWASRTGKSLQPFEPDCTRVEKPTDLVNFFQQMLRGVDKLISHIVQQINAGKVQRKNMSQVASKEYHEARRLLADTNFLKANCRVPPPSLDQGRPGSGKGDRKEEEEAQGANQQDREHVKKKAIEVVNNATRKSEHQKKKLGPAS